MTNSWQRSRLTGWSAAETTFLSRCILRFAQAKNPFFAKQSHLAAASKFEAASPLAATWANRDLKQRPISPSYEATPVNQLSVRAVALRACA
jgi:hypothetical protein